MGSSDNHIDGNVIGTAANENVELGNGVNGVEIDGVPDNTIGRPTAALPTDTTPASNLIVGDRIGVLIQGPGASGNLVLGNGIGGPNDHDGNSIGGQPDINFGPEVEISDASGNTIGGTIASMPTAGMAATNLASNFLFSVGGGGGVLLTSGATSNLVQGNIIQVLAQGAGVEVRGAAGNTIGGTAAMAGNMVVGESEPAIQIDGPGASGNLIAGNSVGIGSDFVGSGPGNAGVLIDGAPNNTIGGTIAGARNIIADNTSGVVITGVTAVGNLVEGNYIGTDASGKVIAANSNYGVQIAGGSDNTIGGLTPGAGNVISGNNLANVAIGSSGGSTSGNVIEGNLIGTNPERTAALPAINPFGLEITDSPGNVVVANVISGNAGVGLAVLGQSSTGTVIQCNKIGTDFTGTASVPNSGDGLLISDDSGVVIGGMALGDGNLISGNGGNGSISATARRAWSCWAMRLAPTPRAEGAGQRGRWGARQQLGGRLDRRGGRPGRPT